MTEEPLWEADDVAAYLKVSKQWVYTEAREGRLPCAQLGRYRRFRKSEIDEWLRGRTSGKMPRSTKK